MTIELKDFIPQAPAISIVEEEVTDSGPGFLKVTRSKAKFIYPDESTSDTITMDRIVRKSDDAVAIVAFAKDEKKGYYIFLRSAVRPAISLRDYSGSGILEPKNPGNLWEVPAGLVDPGEVGFEGIFKAASRELEEEIGFKIDPQKFFFLGKRVFSSVGLSGERIFYVGVDVSGCERTEPTLDGSPFEMFGEVIPVTLKLARAALEEGYLVDSKTEIAITRLSKYLKDE